MAKLVNNLNQNEDNNKKAKSDEDLAFAYQQINALKSELSQIKKSLSWKTIMFLRIRVLNPPWPERTRFHKFVYKTIYFIQRVNKKIKNWLNPLLQPPLIPFKQDKYDPSKPLVSVVIPCVNYGRYIENALDSVLNQTFSNYEIIIVEGGSTDGGVTRDIVKNLKKDKTTVYFRKGIHLVGNNRNYGIDRSKGKYICCLDADDELDSRYLEKAVYILETQNYDIVSAGIQTFGSESKTYQQKAHPNLSDMTKGNHISTIAVFKKEMYLRYGGFRDWGIGKKHIPEDYDLWVRYASKGVRIYNLQEYLMKYRKVVHGSLSTHKNMCSFSHQRTEILLANSKNINNVSIQKSKIVNRLRYRAQNEQVNLVKIGKKVKVLFALPYTVMGGADQIFTDLVCLFEKHKISTSVITTTPFDKSLPDTSNKYLKCTPYLYHLPRFIEDERYWYDFIAYQIKTHNIDCILLGGSKFFYDHLSLIKQDFPNIRVVDIQFNTDVHFKSNRDNARYIDMIVAESREVFSKYTEEFGVKSDRIILIPYGVDTVVFDPKVRKKILRSTHIPSGKFVVTYMGRLSPEKNPEFMLWLAEWLKEYEEIFFVVCGPGSLYEILALDIKVKRLRNIVLTGSINTIDYLAISDVVVVPSKIDGSPIVIKESFAMGIPVIASNVGGIPDIVIDGKTGFLCEPDNVVQFASRIIQLYKSKSLRTTIGKNCREYATSNLKIENVWEKYLDVIKNVKK